MGLFDFVRPRLSGVYEGPVVYSNEGPGGAWRHYATNNDGSPDFRRPLTWVDPDPLSLEATPGAHYRYAEKGDPLHMHAYNRRELELRVREG